MNDRFDHEAKNCPWRIDVATAASTEPEWVHGDCKQRPEGPPKDVFIEIRDLLRSIDGKLTPVPSNRAATRKLGRVFAVGDLVPADVDLVIGTSGLRWTRQYGSDEWHPRDVAGPVISTNELLQRSGHVTEIPAPGSEAGT